MALALIPADICLFVIHELLGLAAFAWVWQDICISFNNSTLAFQMCWGTWQHWWNPEAAWTFSRGSIGMSPEAHHGGFVRTKGTSRFNRSQDRAAFALCFWRFFDSWSPSAQWGSWWSDWRWSGWRNFRETETARQQCSTPWQRVKPAICRYFLMSFPF